MTLKEFYTKDMELQAQISEYRLMSAKMQTEIYANEQQIIKLQLQRTQLSHAYTMDVNYPAQKNLQGEPI